jgi:hypothetical protein
MAYQASNSGPNKRLNGPDGRMRNTQTSNAARQPGVVGPGPKGLGGRVSPPSVPGLGGDFGGAAGLTASIAGAYAQFQNLAAAYRQQRVGIKAGLRSDKAAIRSEAIGAMQEAIGGAIESGMTGSSSAAAARIGVMGQRRADITSAKNEARASIAETHLGEQQAFLDYQMAQQQMEMQAEAARQQAALAQAAIDAQAAQGTALLNAIKGMRDPGASQPHSFLFGGQKFDATPLGNNKVLIGSQTFDVSDQKGIKAYLNKVLGSQQMAANKFAAGRMG